MQKVNIADLKARLSEYLRRVREGRTLTVFDRATPVARLVPYQGEPVALRFRPPLKRVAGLQQVRLPPPLDPGFDVLELLREERQPER